MHVVYITLTWKKKFVILQKRRDVRSPGITRSPAIQQRISVCLNQRRLTIDSRNGHCFRALFFSIPLGRQVTDWSILYKCIKFTNSCHRCSPLMSCRDRKDKKGRSCTILNPGPTSITFHCQSHFISCLKKSHFTSTIVVSVVERC